LFLNELGPQVSGGAKTGLGTGSPLGNEIFLERVDSGVQNDVTIRAGFQVVLDLAFDRRGQPTL